MAKKKSAKLVSDTVKTIKLPAVKRTAKSPKKARSKKPALPPHEEQVAAISAILDLIRSGPAGVKQFAETKLPPWLKDKTLDQAYSFPPWVVFDFAGASLTRLVLKNVHAGSANFASAQLRWSNLANSSFPSADFSGAVLAGAHLEETQLLGANLQNADCAKAHFEGADLENANCQNANFSGTDLRRVNFCGADLTGANLSWAKLHHTRYDKATIWPAGFEPTAEMKWEGAEASPVELKQVAAANVQEHWNIRSFMKRLEAAANPGKLERALAMLKAEKFQLFSEVKDDRLVGIVKSQVKPDLYYSCTIDSQGRYGCCMPNLDPCMGMQGQFCKHLLVLVIGLVHTGKVDAVLMDDWVQAGAKKRPKLQEQDLADTLLRYKGAQAGEIDWRPTETIPEDFYTL